MHRMVTLSGIDRAINMLVLDERSVADSASDRRNIVMWHGFGAGLGVFFRNVGELSRGVPNARVYALDWLGMGCSSRPPFPMYTKAGGSISQTVDFFLNSFEEWRTQQDGLERFCLVGHSLGGYLAALYALRHPERVEKLFLASPVGLPEATADRRVAVTGHRLPALLARLWDANYTPQWMVRALGPLGPRFVRGYVANRFRCLSPAELPVFTSYLHAISAARPSGEYALAALLAPGAWAREPLHSRLASITMPTVFLYGSHDWMDYRHAELAREQMTVPTRIVRIPDADHHLHMDNPTAFNATIIEEMNNSESETRANHERNKSV